MSLPISANFDIPPEIASALSGGTLPLMAVVGPTACGKTRRAVSLARMLNAESISGDSRQVYRGMDIGTGKDLDEYGDVPVHLIDICPPGYKYNLHEFLRDYARAESDIRTRGKNVILCGGTGMYVEAVLAGLRLPEVPENKALRLSLAGKSLAELTEILAAKKQLHNVSDVDTCARAIRGIEIQTYYEERPEAAATVDRKTAIPPDSLIILVDIPRDARRRRIVTQCVTGRISRERMKHDLEIAIHQFAKRQMTWYRGMERRGFKLYPLAWDLPDADFDKAVLSLLASR